MKLGLERGQLDDADTEKSGGFCNLPVGDGEAVLVPFGSICIAGPLVPLTVRRPLRTLDGKAPFMPSMEKREE